MKKILLLITALVPVLTACVSGAPDLSAEQQSRISQIAVIKMGGSPERKYKAISEVSGADCSGTPYGGRIWGDAERAIETLKKKAASLEADAVINVICKAIPFLNNCWAAQKCSGEAVVYQ